MLPDYPVGCYAQYKKDTSIFTTWLGNAAQACGYESKVAHPAGTSSAQSATTPGAPVPSQQRKGKAKKATQKASTKRYTPSVEVEIIKYPVTTEQLLLQAEAVYQNRANIRMPLTVKESLERAIRTRQKCADWYQKSENDSSDYAEDGHLHFIKVLRDILTKLSPEESQTEPKRESKKGASAARKDEANIELQNRFSNLTVEEVDDSFELTPAQVAVATTKKAKGKQVRSADIFELIVEKTFDDVLAIFCFFEDLHKIRDHVRQTWEDHKSGKINLVTAAIITHVAMRMVRSAEEDVCSSVFPGEPNDDKFHPLHECMQRFDHISFDRINFTRMAFTLTKFGNVAGAQWPPPITPYGLLFLPEPHKAYLPVSKKLMHEDRILSQLLIDMMIVDMAKEKCPYPTEIGASLFAPTKADAFTSALRPAWKQRNLSVTSVVACQMITDILEINNYVPTLHKEIMDFRTHVSKSFNFKQTDDTLHVGNIEYPRSIFDTLVETHQTLNLIHLSRPGGPNPWTDDDPGVLTYMNADPFVKGVVEDIAKDGGIELGSPEELTEIIRAHNLAFIGPDKSEFSFSMVWNPLHLGGLAFKLATLYENAGVEIATFYSSISACAHIYNALRQLTKMNLKWPVMERIIQLQIKPIFAGEVPTTRKDIMNRLTLRLKAPNRSKLQSTPWSEELRGLLGSEDAARRALLLIEQKMEPTESKPQSNRRTSKKASSTQKRRTTPDSLLSSLREHVPQMVDDMSIDYVRLSKRCNHLLGVIFELQFPDLFRDNTSSKLKPIDQDAYKLGETAMLSLQKSLRQVENARRNGRAPAVAAEGEGTASAAPELRAHGTYLPLVYKVFEKFLTEEDCDFRVPSMMAGGPRPVIVESTE
ncbi:hypothetical protein F5Y13DRAFT_202579 [Hypoxylon sp. FL1857]|nr:hypothetical protein F5Y13DRAFT_202579 [Hypoxylon sp. FL1857]